MADILFLSNTTGFTSRMGVSIVSAGACLPITGLHPILACNPSRSFQCSNPIISHNEFIAFSQPVIIHKSFKQTQCSYQSQTPHEYAPRYACNACSFLNVCPCPAITPPFARDQLLGNTLRCQNHSPSIGMIHSPGHKNPQFRVLQKSCFIKHAHKPNFRNQTRYHSLYHRWSSCIRPGTRVTKQCSKFAICGLRIRAEPPLLSKSKSQ